MGEPGSRAKVSWRMVMYPPPCSLGGVHLLVVVLLLRQTGIFAWRLNLFQAML